jgi:hypothetical protein
VSSRQSRLDSRTDRTGGFYAASSGPVGGSAQTLDSAWADWDGDGSLDLFVANGQRITTIPNRMPASGLEPQACVRTLLALTI